MQDIPLPAGIPSILIDAYRRGCGCFIFETACFAAIEANWLVATPLPSPFFFAKILIISRCKYTRGLILLTPDKKISNFRSLGIVEHPLHASRRDAISTYRANADNHYLSLLNITHIDLVHNGAFLLCVRRGHPAILRATA